MTITRTNIEIVVDVVITNFDGLIGTRWFRPPNFDRGGNREGGNGGGGMGCDGRVLASFGGGRGFGGFNGKRDEAAAEIVGAGVVDARDVVGLCGAGFGRVGNYLGLDVGGQKILPVELDTRRETVGQEPFEEREVSLEDGAVRREGTKVDSEAKRFLKRQSKDGVGGDMFTQSEAQDKRSAVGKCVSGAVSDHGCELTEEC